MSALAKGVTIGVLVSASLAIPIVATVSYFQNRPDSRALLPTTTIELQHEPLAATITEPAILELEPLVIEASPLVRRVSHEVSQSRDPGRFELELPKVERPPVLRSHPASSPGVDSKGMPPPLQRAGKQTLVYEEHLR